MMLSVYTEGDYDSVLRAKDLPEFDPFKSDLQVFIQDFYPYDERQLRKYFPDDPEPLPEEPEDKNHIYIADNSYTYSDDEGDTQPQKKKWTPKRNRFIVRAFGIAHYCEKYYSISMDLLDFQPYFYIKVPDDWRVAHIQEFEEKLRTEARLDPDSNFDYSHNLTKVELLEAKPFYYYTGDDKFKYAKLTFENFGGFKSFKYLIMKLSRKRRTKEEWSQYVLYESNIEPMIRLIHEQDLVPSGWVNIPKGSTLIPDTKSSDCQMHLEVSYKRLIPMPEKLDIPPIEYASYDIEADSSHGDFPLAKKNYRKLAQDIITEYLKLPQRNSQYLRGVLYKWLTLAFDEYFNNSNINKIYTKFDTKPEDWALRYLATYIYGISEDYYRMFSDLTKQFGEDYDSRHLQEDYICKVQVELEINLPALDLDRVKTGNYYLLAEQLLKECYRMRRTKNVVYNDNPRACIKYWLELAFDEYYDNHNINRIYTKDNIKPELSTLEKLVPQVYRICVECYALLNKPKEKKKPVPKIGPKKIWSQPPEGGQTKISQSFRIRRTKSTDDDAADSNKKSGKDDKDDKQDDNEEDDDEARPDQSKWIKKEEYKFYRGMYKKDPPDEGVKIGRDYYVEWLAELLDRYLPDVLGDPCIQIGTTFKRYGESELFLKHIIVLKSCANFTNEQLIHDENADIYITSPKDAVAEAEKLGIDSPIVKKIKARLKEAAKTGNKKPDVPELEELNRMLYVARRDRQLKDDKAVLRIECYDTEAEVLLAWQKLIKLSDPDVIIGYNIFGFDFKYLWDRAEVLGCLKEFQDLGRIRGYEEPLIEKKLQSSGLGDNLLYFIQMTGRVIIDLLKVVQSGMYRLPIYKLDFVCNHFLYKRKNDLPPQQIFIMQKGTAEDRAVIAKYCIVDCLLCNRLIDKLEILTNNIGMSQVCTVPLSYLFLRGQGVKLLSLVSKICRKEGYLIKAKDPNKVPDDGWYEGSNCLRAS